MEHKIVPDGTPEIVLNFFQTKPFGVATPFYPKGETIPCPSEWTAQELVILAGITPAEWGEISSAWVKYCYMGVHPPVIPFSQYLSDLISLKGLSH